MHKLRGSPHIIVLLFYFLCLWSRVTGLCPIQCKCNDDSLIVTCGSAPLYTVPITLNPELRQLHLKNNHISSIGSSLRFYQFLEYLDFSSNSLVLLSKDNFAAQVNLKHLYLSHNNISILLNETFTNLKSLKTLYLNKNSLSSLNSETFKYLESLELLDLSNNKISFIDERAFFGLISLKTLLLQDNLLSDIPSASFQYISKLHKIDLSKNSFANIPENSFASLKDLKELSLGSCGIELIHQGGLRSLYSLEILHMQDNELSEIPTKALFDVVSLQELYIGQNKFTDIKAKSFQRLKFLHTIEISGCPQLEFIGKSVFSDNENIRTIIINENKKLRHIEEGAFENLPNISHVSLRANAFETFQFSLLPWNKLDLLDVRGNPLVCNCSVVWLWKLLVTKNYSSVDGLSDITQVVCANPPELKDSILPNLLDTDLDCNNIDTRRQIIISCIVLAGAVASAAIIMIGFKYRDKVADVLKTKWGHGRKEPQYQKTSAEEENTILQTAHQSLKMTPVTEL